MCVTRRQTQVSDDELLNGEKRRHLRRITATADVIYLYSTVLLEEKAHSDLLLFAVLAILHV